MVDDDDPYTTEQVERLLGMREHPGPRGRRDLTFLDILSWAKGPGGDNVWGQLAHDAAFYRSRPNEDQEWQSRTGPLDPLSDEACALWDLKRAMSQLSLQEKLVISLVVMGWSQSEIAEVMQVSQSKVSRTLRGQPRRHKDGSVIRNDTGEAEMTTGAVTKLTRAMNGMGS